MRLGIGLGLFKAGLISAGVRIFSAFQTRVIGDSGTVESGTCVVNGINGSALLQQASLLLIPSGYKGGKLYAEIPTNGNGDLTWTRGSDAFRTNASGVIQRVPWNLLQQSETFSNAFWTKTNATISADTTTAPNGTTTADLLYPSTSGSTRGIFTNAISIVNQTTYTWTIYAKASGKNWLYINCWVTVGGGAYFNLSTGVVGTVSSGVTASIENVGNGWYRCIATRTSSATASTGGAEYYVTDADNSLSVTASGTNGVFIWGAQLVEGTTAQTYLPTTDRLNFPRLSYMYGSCPSALLEPQRTNLVLYSEQFNISGTWTNTIGGTGVTPTLTTNSTTSPDGTQNAETIVFNRGAGNTILDLTAIQQSVTIPTTGAYILSVYAKASTAGDVGKQVFLRLGGSGLLIPITLTQNWVRYSRAETSVASGSQIIQIGNRGTITADNTVSVDLFGAQVEAGAYTTTYIPTTSATATRVADSFSRNNIYTNGLISASGGTWFVELRNNIVYTRDASSRIGFGDTSNLQNNSLFLSPQFGGGRFLIFKSISNSLTQLFTTTTGTIKVAIKWNGTSADVFVNGTKQVSATAFTTTNMEFLFGEGVGVPTFIQQMALFPIPLSDTELTQLTTL